MMSTKQRRMRWVEHQIDAVVRTVDGHAVLPADEGEALARLQQKGLQVVAQQVSSWVSDSW